MDSGNVPPVGMALTKANTSSTIEIPASLRSEDRSPSDRNAKDRLWPPGFHTKIAKDPVHRGHSVEQTGTICSLSEHETSRALGDAVHQDPPAARSAAHAQQHFEVPEFCPGLSCLNCAVLVLGNCGPPIGGPSFHRVRRQRSSPSAVRGPVKASPCMRQWVYFLCQFPD